MPKKIIIDGIIGWDIWPRMIRRKLNESKKEDIIVEISSPGGFVFDGLEIFNLIKNYEGNVITHLMGLAASMASYIALAGNFIKVEKNAVFMIHNARAVDSGDQNQLRKTANILEGISNLLAHEYVNRSGKSFDEITELMNNETFFFGDEIVKEGFADEVIESDKKSDKKSAIALARVSIENCISAMKKSDNINSDFEKVAAFLDKNSSLKIDNQLSKIDTSKNTIIENTNSDLSNSNEAIINNLDSQNKKGENFNNLNSVNNTENQTNGGQFMTLEEFKAKYPELFNQVFQSGIQAGIEQEHKRCSAYMEALTILPEAKEIYLKAIKEKKDINDPAVHASVMSLMKAQKTIENSTLDNPGALQAKPKVIDPANKKEGEISNDKDMKNTQNIIRQFNNIETQEVN